MYELIVHHGKSSYVLFGESLDMKDYPTIPVGAWVYIPDTGDLFFIHKPSQGFDLDESDNDGVLNRGKLGEMILGGK